MLMREMFTWNNKIYRILKTPWIKLWTKASSMWSCRWCLVKSHKMQINVRRCMFSLLLLFYCSDNQSCRLKPWQPGYITDCVLGVKQENRSVSLLFTLFQLTQSSNVASSKHTKKHDLTDHRNMESAHILTGTDSTQTVLKLQPEKFC